LDQAEAYEAKAYWHDPLPLLAADIVPVQCRAHASEQFVRSERFYEIAHHVGFDCLRLRPLVRIGGHENSGDRTVRGNQVLMP
jgi:hypothetical protein